MQQAVEMLDAMLIYHKTIFNQFNCGRNWCQNMSW